MSALYDLQHRFAESLVYPDASAPEELTTLILTAGMPAGQRIGIYQANVLGGRIRVLEKLFPVCRRILGAACFGALARGCALLQARPSRDPDAVGEYFPAWLKREIAADPTFAELDYLPDLARLELARSHAWTAPDPAGFDFQAFAESLQRHPAEQHRFFLASGLTPLTSDWPLDHIWQANQSDDAAEVAGEAGPLFWAVRRTANQVLQERVSEAVFRLLQALQADTCLGELDAARLGADPGELLPRLVQQGFVDGFRV